MHDHPNPLQPPSWQRTFRDACGTFATGIAIASVAIERRPTGLVINSFCSLSLEPMLIQWALARTAPSAALYLEADRFGISVLAAEQSALVDRFHRGGPKFSGMHAIWSDDGIPLIPEALAHFCCVVAERRGAGDHITIVGEVVSVTSRPGSPLLFHRGRISPWQAEPAMVSP